MRRTRKKEEIYFVVFINFDTSTEKISLWHQKGQKKKKTKIKKGTARVNIFSQWFEEKSGNLLKFLQPSTNDVTISSIIFFSLCFIQLPRCISNRMWFRIKSSKCSFSFSLLNRGIVNFKRILFEKKKKRRNKTFLSLLFIQSFIFIIEIVKWCSSVFSSIIVVEEEESSNNNRWLKTVKKVSS